MGLAQLRTRSERERQLSNGLVLPEREVLTAQSLNSEAVVADDPVIEAQASESFAKASRRVESVRNSRAA